MAVALSGLPVVGAFDCVDQPATLSQRWKIWKDEFELFVIVKLFIFSRKLVI